jgi:AcrR family transcriptional regulator
MSTTTTRSTAAARRDEVLDAAMIEFAEHGFEGASTEDIARRAGISQPYLFRLFGTKKELFKASVARCLREALEMFQRAAEGKRGEEALHAIGQAYQRMLEAYVRRVSGADWPTVWGFFSTGMLLNVLASMHVDNEPEPWMQDLLSGSGKEL